MKRKKTAKAGASRTKKKSKKLTVADLKRVRGGMMAETESPGQEYNVGNGPIKMPPYKSGKDTTGGGRKDSIP